MNDPQSAPTTKSVRRPLQRRGLSSLVLVSIAITTISMILIFAFIGYEIIYRDRVIPGVSVAGQSMTGMTRAEAKQFLQNKFGNPDAILARLGGQAVSVRDAQDSPGVGERVWRAWPWELGLRTDFDPVADGALTLGHRGSWFDSFPDQARCMWFSCDLGVEAQFDEHTARAYLAWLAPQVDRPPRDASLRIEGLRVIVTPAQNGRELDGTVMLERMRQRSLSGARGDLVLAFRELSPLISDANIVAAKTQIETMLAAPMLLSFGGRTWAIDQPTLAAMISIRPKQAPDGQVQLATALDHSQLVGYLSGLAGDINQGARDARFRFDPTTNALTPIVTSQYGQTLDPEFAARQIEQQITLSTGRAPGNANQLDALTARMVTLPITVTKPTIAMEDAAKFGIKELVAQGVSNFKGSSPGRIQNVRTATAQFDGVVVPPGGIFSFDQYLGDVVEANGFDDAYVIFADRTVLGPGGGVCQVSSTVFRAAFFGGFPIVERWAHAYRVGYYEPPVGIDATVFAPTVDFKFKNDTDAYLLIQPKLDLKTTVLTFNFYGTKPNRTVEMEDPIMENIIPHGPAIYTDDPTLKKGTTKQVDTAHDGADVTVWRKILVNGQVVKREKFFSRYEPWVARYMVGIKK
jgi:vancomycin resistance protein YoaR